MPVRNIQGLKGLSKADRQAWEDEQLVNIGAAFNDYSEAEKDRIYRNQQFRDAFKDREDYEQLKAYSPAERDRIFSNIAFKEAFSEDEDYDKLKALSPEDRDRYYIETDIMNRASERYNTDLNKSEWDNVLSKLEPTALKGLLDAGYVTQAERDKDYLEHMKYMRGESYDPTAFMDADIIDESVNDYSGEQISGGQVAAQFGKAIANGAKNAILPTPSTTEHAVFGALSTVFPRINLLYRAMEGLAGFSDTMEKLPGGDTKWRRLGAKASAGIGTALETSGTATAGLLADAWQIAKERAKSYEFNGEQAGTIDKSYTAEAIKAAPYEYARSYSNRVYGAMLEDAVAKSSEAYSANAEKSGAKDWWGDAFSKAFTEQPQMANDAWRRLISTSAYGREFGNTRYLNLNDAEKTDIMSQFYSVTDLYGPEIGAMTLDNTLRNIISARTTVDDKAYNLGINIGCQAVGVVGETIVGVNSLFNMRNDLYRQGLRDDDGTLKEIWAWRNPVYWGSVAQYGTLSPDKIRKYKYGVGSEEYNEAFNNYVQQVQASHPDEQINLEELSDEFQAQWIKDQWSQGKFKGDQISKTVTVRRAEEEGMLFGGQSIAEGLGMAGQMMGQLMWQAPSTIFKMGKVARLLNKPGMIGKTMRTLDKTASAIGLVAPTLAISEAYAQGNYEQTITKNREALDNYMSSKAFRDKVVNETSTPEFQEYVNEMYMANKDYYDKIARNMIPVPVGSEFGALEDEVVKKARQLALNDAVFSRIEKYQNDALKHIDDGALAAYWTSFGIEALRYGHFFTNYRQFIFGDATKKLGLGKNTWSIGKKGAVNNLTTAAIAKNWAKEALYSGWTNYLDETTSAFATGIGTQQFNDYLGQYYHHNEEYNNILGSLMAGLHSTSESFVNPNSIRAGVIGTMGFLTGGNYFNAASAWISPTARQLTPNEIAARMEKGMDYEHASRLSTQEARAELAQRLGFKDGRNKYGMGRVAFEWASYLTGLSSLQNISQQLSEMDYNKTLCRDLNEKIANDETTLNSNETARALFNAALSRQEAAEQGDEMKMKHAAYQQAFEVFRALHDLRQMGAEGTEVYQNFMEELDRYEQGQITDADIDQFVNNPLNRENTAERSDEENGAIATERIQKNAAKFKELMNSWEVNSAKLANVFGEDISKEPKDVQDIYYDALFKMCLQDDIKARLANIESELSGREEVSTSSNDIVYHAMAKEGTKGKILDTILDELHNQVKTLTKEMESAKKKAKNAKGTEALSARDEAIRLNNAINRVKSLITKYASEKNQLAHLAEPTGQLSEEDILRLNPEERLFVFTTPEAFTEEQQVAIENVRTQLLEQYGDNYLSKIRDAHLLNEQSKSTDTYMNHLLNGGIPDAIFNYRMMMYRNMMSEVEQAAKETINKLLPLANEGLSQELVNAALGMPVMSIVSAADALEKTNPDAAVTFKKLAATLNVLRGFDASIDQAFESEDDKKRASELLADIIRRANNPVDLPKLFSDFISPDFDAPQSDKDIVIKVLEKRQELISQQKATEDNNKNEVVKKEGQKEGETKDGGELSEEQKLIEKNADKETGKFQSLTLEEVDKLNPDAAPKSLNNAGETTALGQTLPMNTQGTAMQGNWVNGYDVKELKATGKQVLKKGNTPNDTFNRWIEWTSLNGYRYQDVVDFELAKILEKNPDMPIHMLVVQGIGEATKDSLIKDAIMLAVEATDDVKRIHNEKYGHYVNANGKEYLIIGRAGLEKSRTKEQEDSYAAMAQEIKAEQDEYFKANPTERFYVSDKYSTQVRYLNGGVITTALVGENQTLHDIMDMLGDEVRDPFGIKKLSNMAWYIQVGTEAREPIGLSSKLVKEGKYYTPADKAYNNGAVFAMVPTGNGKYMPIKLTSAVLTNIKDGEFKDLVRSTVAKLASVDYKTRYEGVVELLNLVVLDSNNNVLIGTEEVNALTLVIDGVEQKPIHIERTPAEDIVNAIMQIPFRVNINQTTFQDPVRMKQLAEAGAFLTDAAVLGATGNNYSVYMCDADGKPMKEAAPVGNGGYVRKAPIRDMVLPYKGAIARRRNGQWVIEEMGKDTRTVTSPTEILQLDCAAQIEEQHLVPVLSGKGHNYYILRADLNNPLAVKKNIYTGEVVVPSQEEMRNLIRKEEAKQAEKAAQAALNERREESLGNGIQMHIDVESEGEETLDQINEEKNENAPLMNIDTKETPKETLTPKQEKSSEETKNVAKNLHMSQKSSNFVELYDDGALFEVIYDALAEKFGEDNIPNGADKMAAFCESKGIPVTGIDNLDAWLDLVKNCK